MVSLGPSQQSLDYTFMYDIPDLRSPYEFPKGPPGSLLRFLSDQGRFVGILRLIEKAGMKDFFSDINTSVTLFIPTDDYIDITFVNSLDRLESRRIILSSMTDRPYCASELKKNKAYFLASKYGYGSRLYIKNCNDKTIINDIVSMVQCNNYVGDSMIHLIDCLITPDIMV